MFDAPLSVSFMPTGSLNNLQPPDGDMLHENKSHSVELLHARAAIMCYQKRVLAHVVQKDVHFLMHHEFP